MPEQASDRMLLARLARVHALGVPGVLDVVRGPVGMCFTASGGDHVDGVTCVAGPGGGYELSLCVVCQLVDLHELGDQVAVVIRRAASVAGIALDAVRVQIVDVRDA